MCAERAGGSPDVNVDAARRFRDFYGASQGDKKWQAAKKAPTTQRWYVQGDDTTPIDSVPELDALIRACNEKGPDGPLVKLTECGACGADSKHYIHLECKRALLKGCGVDELVDGTYPRSNAGRGHTGANAPRI